jgi:hypothetical protein
MRGRPCTKLLVGGQVLVGAARRFGDTKRKRSLGDLVT